MRLLSYSYQGVEHFGKLLDDRTVCELGSSLKAALGGDLATLPELRRLALDDVTLRPVVPNPGKIFCVGHNYEEHRRETNGPVVGHPSIFTRFSDTLAAHGDPMVRPRESPMLDFEGELAVVIGRAGRRIAPDKAMAHVAGFACANDATVRDWQRHTQQFTPGKNFPTTAPLGPWLVTPDEIENLDAITVTTRLNGAIMQQASVAQMIFSIPIIIAYLSTFTPLGVGDIILTGTPGGVGARREPPVWMQPGDVIEIEISHIGTLTNRIVADD